MRDIIQIPSGWRQIPIGQKIKQGDKYINWQGEWVDTYDDGRKVDLEYPSFSGYEKWSGVYIRKIKMKKKPRKKLKTYKCPFCDKKGYLLKELKIHLHFDWCKRWDKIHVSDSDYYEGKDK